ncbi:MAG: alanine--tRNA ligase [Dehalococcoidia bacterium]|jgi:alanyl-tRNA synthetase
MMTSDQVRQAFLDFFKEKEHKIIPSSSLIPKGDPTLLLTTAGMVQFKPYFLGEARPPAPRMASCQKCFRTTDIESVGDSTHLTFFEMLGNFSVGDYFKKEAIAWGWEFVTKWLKLPEDRLWITIYLDDDESFDYWVKTGVPAERILRFGEKDNFWGPAGDSGPCGPCSEIHYDFGEEVGCGRPDCKPNCDCGRFSEIWNLVFTQYNQDKEGKRTPLPRPNIDTGMGLERVTAAVNHQHTVYETDFFVPLLERIAELSGKKYGDDKHHDHAIRVVAEHGRGIAFLISDGVIPDNEGRGYVLRRLLRRASLFGRRLGLDKPFIDEMTEVTISLMGHIYPELKQRRNFIQQVVESEETRFDETLSTGLELLDGIMRKAGGRKEIAGAEAFKLYDTYGFPVELTREIAADKGYSVDIKGFEKEMDKQREKARGAQLLDEETAAHPKLDIDAEVEFVGYSTLNGKSRIIGLSVDDKPVKTIEKGKKAVVVLNSTPFYGEMGGQVGDTGEIRSASGKFAVTHTMHVPPNAIAHQGKVVEGSLSAGDEVEAVVDVERRLDIARNHTATHLLQLALRQVVGEHVHQRGSLVAPDHLRFDFSHLKALTEKQIAEVSAIVNDKIRQNLPVYDEELAYREAIAAGAIALFDEKYGDVVRVLKIGKPMVSAELCGGTHVNATGEIGYFHIRSESSIGSGLRRIEAVTGRGAEEYIDRRLAELHKAAQDLEAELEGERKKALAVERDLARKSAESLVAQAETVKGVTVLAAKVPAAKMEILREMSDIIRDKLKSAIVVLGTVYGDKPAFLAAVTPDLVDKGYDAGKIIKQVAGVAGGSGGGKPSLAQAGGKDSKKLDEALRTVKSLV